MAFILADRVKETTTTTGTGNITLAGAVSQFRAFSSVMANNDTTTYAIVGQTGTEWEVGFGTWQTGGTLVRTTVYASSNAGAAVNFSAGTKDVFMTIAGGNQPHFQAVVIRQDDTVNNPNALDIKNSGTGVDFNVENTAHDANFNVRSSAGYGAAYANLYSTASDFFGFSGWDSSSGDSLKWRVGRAGRTQGISIFTLDGATEAAWFDDLQQAWFWGDVFSENGPIPQLGKSNAAASGNVTY